MAAQLGCSTLSLLLLLGAGSAAAEQLVISSGQEGGSYFYIAERLGTAMLTAGSERVPATVLVSRGSIENLERLDDPDSPVGAALTQADALEQYLTSHPDFADEFIVLADVGRECALFIAARNGDLASASDLKREGDRTLSVGEAGSGAAITYAKLIELESDFANTEPVQVDVMEALLQLKVAGKYTKLAAVLVVQRPRRASPPVELVLKNPEDFVLLPIRESDLPARVSGASLPDGSPVFAFQSVEAGGASSSSKLRVATLCTRGLLLASNEKLSADLRARLSKLMLDQSDQIIGVDE